MNFTGAAEIVVATNESKLKALVTDVSLSGEQTTQRNTKKLRKQNLKKMPAQRSRILKSHRYLSFFTNVDLTIKEEASLRAKAQGIGFRGMRYLQ